MVDSTAKRIETAIGSEPEGLCTIVMVCSKVLCMSVF